ncbi:MAG: T9SS type A sorting domain-containing protein, partial [Bacteroidia bacterium]
PSMYGLVATSNYVMLQNQKILLIDYDSLANAYNVLDSTWTDSLGYYYFCNVPSSSTRIKAEPDPFYHPTELPTYADLSLTWNGGINFHPAPLTSILHNFITLGSYNPGGNGYIGGFVTEYVGNGSTLGPPVPGLTVFLLDMNLNTVVGIQHTNAFGYFGFANIPLHNYKVVVDYAYVVSNNSPTVSLTPLDPIQDSLDFRLHRTWLELVPPPPVAVDPARPTFSASILPNPFGGTARLLLTLEEASECEATVYDAAGRAVAQLPMGPLNAGSHAIEWGESLVPGMYMVRVKSGDHSQVLRAVKQ